MEERPVLSRPRKDQWGTDDEKIAELLDSLDKNVFDPSKWEFFVPDRNKYLSYDELLNEVKKHRYLTPPVQIALIESFKYLPERFKIIKERLFANFERLILSVEEKANFIEELSIYADQVESERDELRDELVETRRKLERLTLEHETEQLKEAYELQKDIIDRFLDKKDKPVGEEVVVPEKQEPVKTKGSKSQRSY